MPSSASHSERQIGDRDKRDDGARVVIKRLFTLSYCPSCLLDRTSKDSIHDGKRRNEHVILNTCDGSKPCHCQFPPFAPAAISPEAPVGLDNKSNGVTDDATRPKRRGRKIAKVAMARTLGDSFVLDVAPTMELRAIGKLRFAGSKTLISYCRD